MKVIMNRIIATVAVVTTIAGVEAVAQEGLPESTPLPDVRAVWLQTNGCSSELAAELQGAGYTLSDTRAGADAIMTTELKPRDVEIGAAAQYTAVLRDKSGRDIFSATGSEDALNEQELCSDIGESIAERIKERRTTTR